MMNSWTNEDIEAIMVQLNNQNLPFKKYEFSALGGGMTLLGSGSSANVYEAFSKSKSEKKFAIKVIGFGNKHVDSDAFRSSVDVQKELGSFENDIVKIYASVELRVWIEGEHNVVKTEIIDPYKEAKSCEGDFLHLQFILMEKISPVLLSHRFKRKLVPYKLSYFDENEIMKLAYEIGRAIDRAHKKNLIHRDIKLENIFYDEKNGHYKLGDFGIARITDNGMASTVAFTKGYGAPEVVGTLDDKYDCTADIYSFGMMLYVLLNELKFPESTDYHPTVFQYVQGYIPPRPEHGRDEFVDIVLKMISFDPDDRYQSMEEVLNEFDKLKFGQRFKYQREHRSTPLMLGMVFALIGAGAWKFTFMPDVVIQLNLWQYIFFGLCVLKSVMFLRQHDTMVASLGIFVLGAYLFFASPVSWIKYFVILIIIFGGCGPGILGGCAFVLNAIHYIMSSNNLSVLDYQEYRWIAVLFISLSIILLFFNALLGERDEQVIKMYFYKNVYWIAVTLFYFSLILPQYEMYLFNRIFGVQIVVWSQSWEPHLVGIFGAAFCIIWMVRERLLIYIEKRREQVELDENAY